MGQFQYLGEDRRVNQLDAAVLCAIAKQTGMSFLPTTERRRVTEQWIASLTEQQKLDLIEVVEECHEKTHLSYDTINDALSLIATPDKVETTFLMLRYRDAFASPWKRQHGSYTTTMRYINGLFIYPDLDVAACTGEDFARVSALLRFAHDVGSNPNLTDLDVIHHYRDREVAGEVTAIYVDKDLFQFVSDNHEHVDALVNFTATRKSADIELMSALIHHKGSHALAEGLL